jgi:amidohydrolase
LPVAPAPATAVIVPIGSGTGCGERTVAVRAELDGLPIEERTGVDWAAVNGAMHACAHDVHAAALVALCRAAAPLAARLPGRLTAVFQHSEEAYPSGAEQLAAAGTLAGVDAVVAAHLHPLVGWGEVALDAGAVNAACANFTIELFGRGGHAAYPHEAVDPVPALAALLQGLYALVGRRTDPTHGAVLGVGVVTAGPSENVIPDSVELRGTVRALAEHDRGMLLAAIRVLADGVAQAHGCRAEVRITEGEPVLVNDAAIVAGARALLPCAGLAPAPALRSCGADDFAWFSALAPIAMAFVGLEGAEGYASRPLHHPEFLPPDAAVCAVARTLAVLFCAACAEPQVE